MGPARPDGPSLRAPRRMDGRGKRINRAMVRLLALASAWLVRRLPLRWVQGLGDLLGWLLFVTVRGRQRMADRNLAAVFGDKLTPVERKRIRCFSTRNTAKTMLELLRLPAMTEREMARFVSVRDSEHLDEAVARGGGVIVVTGHFGNWEVLAETVARRGHALNVVARDSADPGTAEIINTSREGGGTRVIERSDVRGMLQVLRGGGILGILPDQHAKRGGIVVDFMGLPASTFTGPAVLALRTGALVVPAFARRTEDDHIICEFRAPFKLPDTGDRKADTAAGTQLVNDVIGREIMRRPGQWLWLHDRWRPDDRVELD